MNNCMNYFKNPIIVVLTLLPFLVIAQEIETKTFDFGLTNLEIHGQPAVSDKSTGDKKNTVFYQADITINNSVYVENHDVAKTNIYAEKAEMFMLDNKGRPQTLILQDAMIESNVISAFAKEAIVFSDSGTIKFLTDKAVISSEGKESDSLNNAKTLTKTEYYCQGGKVVVDGQISNFSQVSTCDKGVTVSYNCSSGSMVVTYSVSTFCGSE